MTNRQLIEYLKVLKDGTYLKEDKKYDIILDSNVSIKDFLFEYRDINIEDKMESMWNILLALFKSANNENELKEYLREITKTLRVYKKYLDKTKLDNTILRMLINIQFHQGKITLETINKNKLVYKCDTVKLDNITYNIEYHYYTNYKMELNNALGEDIENVGAIIFKDDRYKIYKCDSFEDMEKLEKEVINTYNFDLAIIAS